MGKAFTRVETWLTTGVAMPGAIPALERIMREPGRRLKKIACNRTDEGVTRIAEILPKKTREPEAREEHRMDVEHLRGNCRAVILEAHTIDLSIAGCSHRQAALAPRSG